MRLPDAAHLGQSWRIHALTPDFRLEDVWSLPTPGAAEDFPRLGELIAAPDGSQGGSAIARALFAIRWKLGEWFGWDDDAPTTTLRDRLPSDLDPGPELRSLPFTPLYMADDEWAGEIANRTMHGVMHLGWVPDPSPGTKAPGSAPSGAGGSRGQMAVLVKPNGRLGEAYMAAIRPFRYRFVYPAMLRELGRRWRAAGLRASGAAPSAPPTPTSTRSTSATPASPSTGGLSATAAP